LPRGKRIQVTTETRETLVIRKKGGGKVYGHCRYCGKEVEYLPIDTVVGLTGIPARELFRLVEDEQVHSQETKAGFLLLCSNSIKQRSK
jgi:hypothetical protein